jgi:hypothetical protein
MFEIILNGLKAEDPKTKRAMKTVLWINLIGLCVNAFVGCFFLTKAIFVFLGWV